MSVAQQLSKNGKWVPKLTTSNWFPPPAQSYRHKSEVGLRTRKSSDDHSGKKVKGPCKNLPFVPLTETVWPCHGNSEWLSINSLYLWIAEYKKKGFYLIVKKLWSLIFPFLLEGEIKKKLRNLQWWALWNYSNKPLYIIFLNRDQFFVQITECISPLISFIAILFHRIIGFTQLANNGEQSRLQKIIVMSRQRPDLSLRAAGFIIKSWKLWHKLLKSNLLQTKLSF